MIIVELKINGLINLHYCVRTTVHISKLIYNKPSIIAIMVISFVVVYAVFSLVFDS